MTKETRPDTEIRQESQFLTEIDLIAIPKPNPHPAVSQDATYPVQFFTPPLDEDFVGRAVHSEKLR